MLEQNAASYKPILTVILGCVIFLLIMYIGNKTNNSSRLYICNNGEYQEKIIQIEEITILISPSDMKTALECLGKAMPFYDRTIDITAGHISDKVRNDLNDRYKVLKYTSVNNILNIENISTKEVTLR